MPKTSMSKMTAARLRIVLLSSVVILIIASAGLIVLGRQVITSYGIEVASAVSVSSSDEKTLRDLEVVSKSLEQQKPIVEKSKRIIADKTKTYAYQNQIIQDITRYAAMANIQIAGFAFSDGGGASTSCCNPSHWERCTGSRTSRLEPSQCNRHFCRSHII